MRKLRTDSFKSMHRRPGTPDKQIFRYDSWTTEPLRGNVACVQEVAVVPKLFSFCLLCCSLWSQELATLCRSVPTDERICRRAEDWLKSGQPMVELYRALVAEGMDPELAVVLADAGAKERYRKLGAPPCDRVFGCGEQRDVFFAYSSDSQLRKAPAVDEASGSYVSPPRLSTPPVQDQSFVWTAGHPNTNEFSYNGLRYRTVENDYFRLSVSKPVRAAKWTMFNALIWNKTAPRIDVGPEEIECYCAAEGTRPEKQLKAFAVPPAWNRRNLFLENTLMSGESKGGTVMYSGNCRQYVVRWRSGNRVIVFPFD
jgi:hypothetical protein